jgi:hypothetical protein
MGATQLGATHERLLWKVCRLLLRARHVRSRVARQRRLLHGRRRVLARRLLLKRRLGGGRKRL